MRIDHLEIRNFKCFDERHFDFHPQVNLFVGVNGSGKSSMLDALGVAASTWFLGIGGVSKPRNIAGQEVRQVTGRSGSEVTFEAQLPVEIAARGEVQEREHRWLRSLNDHQSNDPQSNLLTGKNTRELRQTARAASGAVRAFGEVVLPVIAYYGVGRLWQGPPTHPRSDAKPSRFDGYRNGLDPRAGSTDLIGWLRDDAWGAFQEGVAETALGQIIKGAILSCLEGGERLYYHARRKEVLLELAGQGPRPFSNLSDGQRNLLAMVGDLAIRAALLNPHLEQAVLQQTPGVVLIDELDLHLHPRWQRTIIEDLRRTFPHMQFFATSHSPFLIQTLREGELIVLDREPGIDYAGKGIEEVARHIMGVDTPEMSPRYKEMVEVAKRYFGLLNRANGVDEAEKAALKARLEAMTAPYADNPAYVAFLEMKRGAAGVE